MRITRNQLRRIISEEMRRVLREDGATASLVSGSNLGVLGAYIEEQGGSKDDYEFRKDPMGQYYLYLKGQAPAVSFGSKAVWSGSLTAKALNYRFHGNHSTYFTD